MRRSARRLRREAASSRQRLSHFMASLAGARPPGSPCAPDLLRGLNDQPELVPLLLLAEVVALLGGGEAALRGQAQLVDVHEPRGVLDPPLQLVLALQIAALGGDQPEHDPLAPRHEPQRLEAA